MTACLLVVVLALIVVATESHRVNLIAPEGIEDLAYLPGTFYAAVAIGIATAVYIATASDRSAGGR